MDFESSTSEFQIRPLFVASGFHKPYTAEEKKKERDRGKKGKTKKHTEVIQIKKVWTEKNPKTNGSRTQKTRTPKKFTY